MTFQYYDPKDSKVPPLTLRCMTQMSSYEGLRSDDFQVGNRGHYMWGGWEGKSEGFSNRKHGFEHKSDFL